MRWLEQCGQWCTGGWQNGTPRFARLVSDGQRLFAEALVTDNDVLAFQHRLISALWSRRDSTISVYQWLDDLRELLLDDLMKSCRTLRDEAEIFSAFIERTEEGGDCATMNLAQFAGQGDGNNNLTLSTLHSAKGREFSVVMMFGMDDGRIPRPGSNARELRESRRLFYVGFTRSKTELHMIFSLSRASPFVVQVQERLDAED